MKSVNGMFLCAIFDERVRRDVGRFYVQIFDLALEAQGRRRPGRIDPCLRGSGKKFKKCCGRR